jgi:hypothetical protein
MSRPHSLICKPLWRYNDWRRCRKQYCSLVRTAPKMGRRAHDGHMSARRNVKHRGFEPCNKRSEPHIQDFQEQVDLVDPRRRVPRTAGLPRHRGCEAATQHRLYAAGNLKESCTSGIAPIHWGKPLEFASCAPASAVTRRARHGTAGRHAGWDRRRQDHPAESFGCAAIVRLVAPRRSWRHLRGSSHVRSGRAHGRASAGRSSNGVASRPRAQAARAATCSPLAVVLVDVFR